MASALPTGGEISTSLVRDHLYNFDKECFVDKLSTTSQNGCSAAYSTRLLRSNYYGPMVRVRRNSDNAEQDFYGDVFGKLGTRIYATGTSLTTWLGGATGYVRMMYDQSGNVRNIGQATNANQPTITTSAITYSGSQWLELTNTQIPTAAMTSNSSGGLVASASTEYGAGWETYRLFNFNSGDGWASAIGRYSGSGFYVSSVTTTDVNGVVHSGEWVQLQLASAIKLNSFYITPRTDGGLETTRAPRNFTILGSNNGTTWNVVHNEFNINNWTTASKTFTVTTPNVQSYSYYRMVIKRTGNFDSGMGNSDIANFMEWILNPTTVPLVAGDDTYTYYAIWTPTTNGNCVVCEQNGSGDSRRACLLQTDQLKYGFNGQGNDAHYMVSLVTNVKRRTVMMCNHTLSTNNVEIYDEGVLYKATSSAPVNLNVGSDIFIIGRKSNGTEYMTGQINEVIVTNNTAFEREALLYFTPTLLTKPKDLFPKPKKALTFFPATADNSTPINHGALAITNLHLDLINVSHGSAVSDWNGYSQGTAGNRPVYNNRGGLTNEMGYVNFDRASSHHLNGGSRTLNIATNGGFTALALVKFTGAVATWERIFDFGSGAPSNNIGMARYSTSNEIVVFFYTGGSLVNEFRVAGITQDEWAIFGVRYRHSDRYTELLKNGVVISTITLGSALTDRTLSTCYIGRSNWTGDAYFNGQMGGVYVFDRYLSNNEMIALSNSLTLYSLPNIPRHISDLTNVYMSNTTSPVYLPTRNGWSGYFNGDINNYIDIQDVPAPPMSYCFWFNNVSTNGIGIGNTIVGLCDANRGAPNYGIQVDTYNNNTLNFFCALPGTWTSYTGYAIAANTWYHVVVCVNTNYSVTIYVNGSLLTTLTGTTLPPARSRLIVGADGTTGRGSYGYIQDFRVYDYILRSDEVTQIYDGVSMAQTSLQPTSNYLVNTRNWYSIMQLGKSGTGAYVAQLGGNDPNVQYRLLNATPNVNNYLYNNQRIQDYRSFTCSYEIYTSDLDGTYSGGDQMYFFIGATSLPVNENVYNGCNYVDFQVYNASVNARRGMAFFRNGTNVAQSDYSQYVGVARWVPVTITYQRSGTEAVWVVNIAGNEVINYTDTNNESWRNSSGTYWGIGGWTGGALMSAYIRRVELTYVPDASSQFVKGLVANSTKRYPEAPLTANSSLNCVASASSEFSNNLPAFKAFDYGTAASDNNTSATMYHSAWDLYNTTTGAYIGGQSTTISGVVYSGEWLQIQLPYAISLTDYVISCRPNYETTQSPNTWIILGSNDGNIWNLLDTESNVSNWDTTLRTQNFKVGNTSNRYTYFRMICSVTGNVSGSSRAAFVVSEWQLNGYRQFGTKYPITPLLNEYPPIALTATTTTLSGQTHGNGVYSCAVSTSYFGAENAVQVFNKNEGDLWHGTEPYNASTGVYAGSRSTVDTNGTSHLGEWAQINLPNAITLGEVAIGSSTGNGGDDTRKCARDFVILGSNNGGTTWTLVHTTTNFVDWSGSTLRRFTVTTTGKFSSYRLVVKRVGTSDAGVGQDLVFLSEWRLYEKSIFDGNGFGSGTYNVTYSSSWQTGNYTGWKAFDNNSTGDNVFHVANNTAGTGFYSGTNGSYIGSVTTTISGSSYAGEWLQIELPQPIRLTRYSLLARSSNTNQSAKTWKIAGSNDNSTWTEVDSETNITGWAGDVVKTFTTTNTVLAYKYYRMVTNQIAEQAGLHWSQREWMLYDDTTGIINVYNKTPGLIEGLTWKYYNEYLADDMSAFDTRTYRNIGRTTNLSNLREATNGQYYDSWSDSYSIEWTGYFRANATGTWSFEAYSDDSCYLWIGQTALSGYTTSNYLLYENSGHPGTRFGSIFLIEGVYYPFRMRWGEGGGADYISLAFTSPNGTKTSDGRGYFFSSTGSNQAYPAESAKIIKDITETNTDGVYYINVNGTSTPVHCLMNDNYDGGGWMMLMKATRGTTFNYSANYWTTANTLNPTDTTRNDADAKYDTFNYSQIKDVMAIWPDIPSSSYTNVYGKNGGSLNIQDGWVWKIDNWYDAVFPPYGLTANGQTLNDITYTASSSTSWGAGRDNWKAFNYLTGDGEEYHGVGGQYDASGIYIGSNTTTVSGVSYSGDWLQLQMSSAQYINRIGMIPRPGFDFRMAKSFVFAGSNNGTTWTNLYEISDTGSWGGTWKYFNLTRPGIYSYYRIVIRSLFGADSIQIGELRLFGDGATTALNGFQRTRDAHPNNPFLFNGFSSGVFSSQSGAFRHVFGGGSHVFGYLPPFRPARWGFLFNNEGDFLSNDTGGGIGTGESAGSFNGGISRTARVEVYGR